MNPSSNLIKSHIITFHFINYMICVTHSLGTEVSALRRQEGGSSRVAPLITSLRRTRASPRVATLVRLTRFKITCSSSRSYRRPSRSKICSITSSKTVVGPAAVATWLCPKSKAFTIHSQRATLIILSRSQASHWSRVAHISTPTCPLRYS